MADALDILSIEIASLECAIEKRKLTLFFFLLYANGLDNDEKTSSCNNKKEVMSQSVDRSMIKNIERQLIRTTKKLLEYAAIIIRDILLCTGIL